MRTVLPERLLIMSWPLRDCARAGGGAENTGKGSVTIKAVLDHLPHRQRRFYAGDHDIHALHGFPPSPVILF
jgi:hypothetical protein